jgi:hypothetical protein
MKLPKRRIIWMTSLLIAIFLFGTARSTLGVDGIIQESRQIPFGILFLLVAVIAALVDIIKSILCRKRK